MQFSYALLAFITSIAAEAVVTGTIDGDLAALPQCARDCIGEASLSAGCSSSLDPVCQCGSARNRIEHVATPCIIAKCDASETSYSIYDLINEICDLVAVSQGSSSTGGSSPSSSTTHSHSSQSTGSDASPTTTDYSAPTTTGGGHDSADSTSSSTPPSSNSKSVPVGAIVGGVVGGLADIALFAFSVIFLVIRSRRQQQNNPAPPPQQSPQDGYSKPELNPQHLAQPYIPPPSFTQGELVPYPPPNQEAFQQQQPPKPELDAHTPTQSYPQQAFIPGQQPPQQLSQQTFPQQQPPNPELDSHTPTQTYPQQVFILGQQPPQPPNQQYFLQPPPPQTELDSRPTNPIFSQQPYVPGQQPPQLRDGSTVYEAP